MAKWARSGAFKRGAVADFYETGCDGKSNRCRGLRAGQSGNNATFGILHDSPVTEQHDNFTRPMKLLSRATDSFISFIRSSLLFFISSSIVPVLLAKRNPDKSLFPVNRNYRATSNRKLRDNRACYYGKS